MALALLAALCTLSAAHGRVSDDPPGYMPPGSMTNHFRCGTEYSLGDATSAKNLPDFAASAATWCNASLVPPEKRVPEQLRGLYWMMNLSVADVAFCTSLAEWDSETMTGTLEPWTMFVARKEVWETVPSWFTTIQKIAGWAYTKSFLFTLKFKDSSFREATITTNNPVLNFFESFPLRDVPETPDGLVKSEKPDDILYRPTLLFNMFTFSEYWAVRIMDGDGHVHQERYALMKQLEKEQAIARYEIVPSSLIRYEKTCGASPEHGGAALGAGARIPAPLLTV